MTVLVGVVLLLWGAVLISGAVAGWRHRLDTRRRDESRARGARWN